MSLTNLAFKFNSVLAGGAMSLPSIIAADGDVANTVDAASIGSATLSIVTDALINLILRLIFVICRFVLNLIEFLQFVVSSILGISVTLEDYVVLDSKNPLVKMLTNESVLQVFKYMIGVAIVLIIVFTIFAIVKSEYQFAIDGDPEVSGKGRILARTLRSFFTLGMFPLMLLFGVIVINAVLVGFNDILRNGQNTTLASQIFISSAYNANNYRSYADNDVRVPILINFEDPIEMGRGNAYSPEELAKFYQDFQPTGQKLFNDFADYKFSSFSDTVTYKHNRVYNKSNYNGFEQFVCTREQYYVMADFIDYAVKNNLRYYVKNMTDVDINWKYVNSTIYDKDNQTLKISYKDASNISGSESYTVEYCPSSDEISTPISDAIKTISALLAVGDYSDVKFNIMDRLEDSINVVEWHTDSVYLRFSEQFRNSLNNGSADNMSATDQLILYELSRFEYNNDLNCSISDLINEKGVLVPLHKIDKRVYQPSTGSYILTESQYVAELNGNYYAVEENAELLSDSGNKLLRDEYNDPYFTLLESTLGMNKVTESGGKYYSNSVEVDANFVVDFGTYNGINLGLYTKNLTSFEDINREVAVGSYPIELENGDISYAIYDDKVSEVIKQVSWPQKLINDLQVIYKDININQLLTTNKWLTQLGEYKSASDTSGDKVSNISTAIIHPLGLILSELFLGNISEADSSNSYGSLMFESMFDENTVKALVLSMLGEENYYQLSAELEYFIEIFNVFMGPVLDEIAYYENFELLDGVESTVQLYTYKAYLASVLISSSSAEWFYKTATALLGVTDISERILNEDGYYKKYSEFSDDDKNYIKEIYDKTVEELKSKDITKYDKDYPEYLNALKEYMEGDFNKRLDIVLNSFLSDEKRQELAKQAYAKYENNNENAPLIGGLYKAYNDLINASELSAEDKELINAYIKEVSGTYENDSNFNLVNSSMLIDLKKMRSKLMSEQEIELEDGSTKKEASVFETYFSGKSNYNAVKTKLNNYFNALDEYVDAQTNYLSGDTAYKNVGKLKSLEKQKGSLAAKIATLVGNDDKDLWEAILSTNDLSEWKNIKAWYKQLKTEAEADTSSNGNKRRTLIGAIGEYINIQDSIDNLNRYYITYGIEQCASQREDIALKVVVNNKSYTVGQNFTKAKFIEYVMGAEYLKAKGLDTVFVDENYKGLVRLDNDGKLLGSFNTLTDFLVELGDMSAVLSQMTNLVNLSDGSIDEVIIGNVEKVDDEGNTITEPSLAKYILKMLIEEDHLPIDIIRAFFDIDVDDEEVKTKAIQTLGNDETDNARLNTVLSYLLLTDTNINNENYIDYTKLTLQELRQKCLQFLIDYEEQQGDTAEQNQKRYLAVFALACSDWYTNDNPETEVVEIDETVKYSAVNNSWVVGRKEKITGFSSHKQSQATILRLAGLDNRPYEELVGAEYTIDFNVKGVDEANGDIFIICTFDEETKYFVPFMMANNADASLISDEDGNWLSKYDFTTPYTDYYSVDELGRSQFYPVIAKGVVTTDGIPTAIRENEGRIEYYREDVIAHDVSNFGLSSYFMSVDQIQVQHTGLSYIANTISQLATGKSLIEHLVETIPAFAAHSDFNLCFGVREQELASSLNGYTSMSFNFDESVCLPMSFYYELEEMNIIILIMGTVMILMALFKAMWGVVGRLYDITLLFLLGPAVISTISLRSDSKDKDGNVQESGEDTYSRWKETLMEKLLSVFAYAIGFNIFFVVVPIISDMTLFTTNEAFANLPLFKNLSVSFLNEIGRVIFLIATAYLTTRAPDLFAKISKTNNGFKEGEATFNNVKATINEVTDRTSGAHAVDSLRSAASTAKGLIPGGAFGAIAAGKIRAISDKRTIAKYKKKAMQQGVSEEVADKMAKELQERINDKREIKKNYANKRDQQTSIREMKRSGNADGGKIKEAKESIKKAKENISKIRAKHKTRRKQSKTK